MIFTNTIRSKLEKLNIRLGYGNWKNEERYGWIKNDDIINITCPIKIEQNSALYGGKYEPSLGGIPYSGLTSIGICSYSHSALPEPMRIGRYCSISNNLVILDSAHPIDRLTTSIISYRPDASIFDNLLDGKPAASWHPHGGRGFPEIEHDVWIGRDVTLGMGIRIGTGSIVAAKSVVTRDVLPYSIVAGSPARVRKMRFEPSVCEALQSLEWWTMHPQLVFRATQLSLLESLRVLEAHSNDERFSVSFFEIFPEDKTVPVF